MVRYVLGLWDISVGSLFQVDGLALMALSVGVLHVIKRRTPYHTTVKTNLRG